MGKKGKIADKYGKQPLEKAPRVQDATTAPKQKREYDYSAKPIWEIAEEIGASIPDEEWEKIPKDLAQNFEHYMYGAPRADE